MRVNMQSAPKTVTDHEDVMIGNVYKTQKKLYVVVHIVERESACGNSAVAFSIDSEGNIEGAVAYNTFYFSRQKLVGFAHIPETIEVDWF